MASMAIWVAVAARRRAASCGLGNRSDDEIKELEPAEDPELFPDLPERCEEEAELEDLGDDVVGRVVSTRNNEQDHANGGGGEPSVAKVHPVVVDFFFQDVIDFSITSNGDVVKSRREDHCWVKRLYLRD